MKKNLILLLIFSTTIMSFAQQSSIKSFKGYFNFSYNEESGSITMEVKELNKEFLYVSSLSSGIGSNDIGLDRGQLGGENIKKT